MNEIGILDFQMSEIYPAVKAFLVCFSAAAILITASTTIKKYIRRKNG